MLGEGRMRAGGRFALPAAALAGCVAAAPALASTIDAADVVPGHPGVTYLDLIRQAAPGLATNRSTQQVEGHLAALPRHLAGKDFEGDPPDPLVLGLIEDQRIKEGGKPRIALLADFGPDTDRVQSATVLMLFDDAPRPKLLDAVDVGLDKESGFNEPAKLALGPGDDALVTYSEHFNSDQTYSGRLLVLVRHDRFRLIDRIFTLADRACGWDRTERPAFSVRPGQPYGEIDVVVTEALKRSGETCGDDKIPKAYRRRWETVYRWNAGKGAFVAGPDGLSRLGALDEKRF
jgi:hypothetical protein